MKILSIDTSSNICTVAILQDDKLLKEITQNNGLTHSANLMPIIQTLLSSLSFTLKDIDLIVCDKGPGSFTGIRIGVATTMAFSDSLNINSIGITSLEALAYNVHSSGTICSLIDAKNDNVYVGVFEISDGKIITKRHFSCENILNILNELKNLNHDITFVGDGSVIYKEQILSHIPNSKFSTNNDLSAYNLGLAGFSHFLCNDFSDLLPLYLRKPQAERQFKEDSNGKNDSI